MTPSPPAVALFDIEDAAFAIDRSSQLIKKWQTAGVPFISADDVRGRVGRGGRSVFTLGTVTNLALMAEMTAWGAKAEIAWESAILFTRKGKVGRVQEGVLAEGSKPSATYLIMYDQRKIAKLVSVHKGAPVDCIAFPACSALLIDCEKIENQVVARLLARGEPSG